MSPKTLTTLADYGPGFQIRIISSLLTQHKFLRTVYDILNPQDFQSQAHQWIVTQIIKYYKEFNSPPSMDILKIELKKLENEILQISIKEQLREAYTISEEKLEYEEKEFISFCKNQKLKKALLGSVELLKLGDYDSIRNQINNALKAGVDRDMGHDYLKEVELRYDENNRNVVPTPWEDVNELLQGGLGNGDLGIIFGNPGGGKSWTLVDIGSFALKLGYNVLHFTLELGEIYVGRRYDANLSGIAVNKLAKHKDEIKEMLERNNFKYNLVIREYAPKRASIQTLEVNYQKCLDQGFKPDLILIDYLDLLRPSNKRIIDKKEGIDDVYIDAKGMAKELDIPIWSVSQVNRLGAQDDIIEGDKAAGSYDKIMIGDFIVSLSRKRKDKIEGTGRLHIIKNRYGVDGITFKVEADLSVGKFKFYEFDEEELEREKESKKISSTFSSGINNAEKKKLKDEFFRLSQELE
jgi:replicative DNA helicase